jgi:hypothetical protein
VIAFLVVFQNPASIQKTPGYTSVPHKPWQGSDRRTARTSTEFISVMPRSMCVGALLNMNCPYASSKKHASLAPVCDSGNPQPRTNSCYISFVSPFLPPPSPLLGSMPLAPPPPVLTTNYRMPETEDTNASAFCVISGVALTTAESDRTVVLKRREHIARRQRRCSSKKWW